MQPHEPKPGRYAFICDHKDHEKRTPLRRFVGPEDFIPECEKHGPMQRQANNPYLGQEVPHG